MISSVAEVKSQNPQRVLKMLCNHWRHRFEIHSQRDGHALIDLQERGSAEFQIQGEVLHTTASHTDADKLPTLLGAIESHLQRFAKDEQLIFDWQPAGI